jgi:predicted transcriptional regulator
MHATDQVLEVIRKSKSGMDNVTIAKQTGLNQKQVSSALLRLKKYGKIKSVKRGVHTAA